MMNGTFGNNVLTAISFATYMKVVSYLQANYSNEKYSYRSGYNTGNITWRDKKNKIVAKRIVKTNEDDLYLVDESLLSRILKP